MRWLAMLFAAVPLVAEATAQDVPAGVAPSPAGVPTAEEVAAAAPRALAIVADLLLQERTGGLGEAQQALQEAARSQRDVVFRYILLQEAVALAERADEPHAALAALDEVTADFPGEDGLALRLRLLQRMVAAGRPSSGTAIANLALREARARAAGVVDRRSTPDADWRALAMRGAVATGDALLLAMVSDRCAELARLAALWSTLPGDNQAAVDRNRELLRGLAVEKDVGDAPLRPLARHLPALHADELDRSCRQLGAQRLLALAASSPEAALRRALGRQAMFAAISRFDAAAENEPALAQAVTQCVEALATAPGITRFRPGDGLVLDRWIFANGTWALHDDGLRGACTGTENFATLRHRYGSVRSVVVRGGIRSADGCNFRCKVGEVNLLLNWEVAAENHLWLRGRRFAQAPPALQVGKEHTLLFVQAGTAVHVCIDDRLWWTVQDASLSGTITVYPALGSEIFVREILIDGEPEGLATGPIGVLM